MTDRRFSELVNLYLDEEIPAHQIAPLREELRARPFRRKQFRQLKLLHKACAAALKRDRSPLLEFPNPPRQEIGSRRGKGAEAVPPVGRLVSAFAVFGAVAACLSVGFVYFNFSPEAPMLATVDGDSWQAPVQEVSLEQEVDQERMQELPVYIASAVAPQEPATAVDTAAKRYRSWTPVLTESEVIFSSFGPAPNQEYVPKEFQIGIERPTPDFGFSFQQTAGESSSLGGFTTRMAKYYYRP